MKRNNLDGYMNSWPLLGPDRSNAYYKCPLLTPKFVRVQPSQALRFMLRLGWCGEEACSVGLRILADEGRALNQVIEFPDCLDLVQLPHFRVDPFHLSKALNKQPPISIQEIDDEIWWRASLRAVDITQISIRVPDASDPECCRIDTRPLEEQIKFPLDVDVLISIGEAYRSTIRGLGPEFVPYFTIEDKHANCAISPCDQCRRIDSLDSLHCAREQTRQ